MSNLPLTEMKSDVRLDSEEAHYTRLVEQYRELEAEKDKFYAGMVKASRRCDELDAIVAALQERDE